MFGALAHARGPPSESRRIGGPGQRGSLAWGQPFRAGLSGSWDTSKVCRVRSPATNGSHWFVFFLAPGAAAQMEGESEEEQESAGTGEEEEDGDESDLVTCARVTWGFWQRSHVGAAEKAA